MKALKKLISMFTASAILAVGSIGVLPEEGIGGFAFSVRAADIVDSGECGQLTWTLDSEGTLTISGTGLMAKYSSASSAPWSQYRGDIINIKIENGATSIGTRAFELCEYVTSITIPDSMTRIESYAFNGCASLTSIEIPDSVIRIDTYAFSDCASLTSITIENPECEIYDSSSTISSTATIYTATQAQRLRSMHKNMTENLLHWRRKQPPQPLLRRLPQPPRPPRQRPLPLRLPNQHLKLLSLANVARREPTSHGRSTARTR